MTAVLVLAAVLPAGSSASPSAPVCSGGLCTVTVPYTGAADSWTVPADVHAATFTVAGAGGGGPGGAGGDTTGTVGNLTPGDGIGFVVGGQGSGSAGGFGGGGPPGTGGSGGGGGASSVTVGGHVVLVAGGGGGAGAIGQSTGTPPAGGAGGAGGENAANGTAGTDADSDGAEIAGGGGGTAGAASGTDGAPGAGGVGTDLCAGTTTAGNAGTAGASGQGGAGAGGNPAGSGGGGGGGYAGGGGGGAGASDTDTCSGTVTAAGGGGGGGSSFASTAAGNVSFHDGTNPGDGSARIVYAEPVGAADHIYVTNAGATLNLPAPGLLAGASAPAGVTLTAILTSTAANGSAAVNGDGSFTYTPNGGFSGSDSFTYSVSDGVATSAPATVTVTVLAPSPPPVIGPPAATIATPAPGQTFTLGQAASTSFSCAEAPGGPGIASCVDTGGSSGGSGTLDTSQTGTFAYSVTATSQDGETATATVTYTVTALLQPKPPVNTARPTLSGAATLGASLACSQGTWTQSPTSYLYAWARDGTPIAGANGPRYTLVGLDEGSVITCVVVAVNDDGFGTSPPSEPRHIAVRAAARCPAPSGTVTGLGIGPVRIGEPRAKVAQEFNRSSDTRSAYADQFCLTPAGIDIGYLAPAVGQSLSKRTRAGLAGKVIWISTASPYYAIAGIRPGASVPSLAATLALEPPIAAGGVEWYFAPVNTVTAIFKTQNGTVQEIAYANALLTGSAAQRRRLLSAFG